MKNCLLLLLALAQMLGLIGIGATGHKVMAQGCAPVANFGFTTNELGVFFSDSSTNNPTSWSWDFGDGGTSAGQNPSYTYAVPGTYTVCLTVTNSCGSDSMCQVITVSCTAPIAGWSIISLDLSVAFIDTSTNNPATWFWDFGDGNSSNMQSPGHSYSAPGTYTVCLIVSSICGSDTSCQSITVTCTAPTAGFNYTDNDLSVSFGDISAGNPTSWTWDFGDGNTSTQQMTNHIYASPGTYNVCLMVSNPCGRDTFCQNVTVTCPVPISSFVMTPTFMTVDFTDFSSNSANSWSWDFGDGNTSVLQNPSHTYTVEGTYTICLTASSMCGTGTTSCDSVTVMVDGISELSEFEFKLFPNPVNETLNFSIPTSIGLDRYVIRDMTGRIWIEDQLKSATGTNSIGVSELPSGSYLIEVWENNARATARFVK